jgi:polar amino acid transport system permease protein
MKYVMEILPSLFSGAGMTLQIFFETLIFSLPLGILVSFGLSSRFAPLKWLLNFYVWLMRGTPLLLQLIFVFYGLPIVGLTFPRYMAALVAFVLNYTAYFAEIDRGQFEAAKVLQLTYGQTLRKIVIPQVIKIVLPSIGNEVINLVKDSSLVYVIGLGDLLRAGNLATARDVTLVPLVLVALIYLLLIGLCTLLLRQLEKHYSYYR